MIHPAVAGPAVHAAGVYAGYYFAMTAYAILFDDPF